MSVKPSQRQADEVVWEVVAVRPGEVGLDTRLDAPVGSCRTLKNASFVESSSVSRRPGYVGQALQDGSDYPQSISGAPLSTEGHWVYGHGLALESTDVVANSHVPFAGRGKGVFCLDNQIAVWTGDRLLIHRDGDTALGASDHWIPNQTQPWGVPAYLPLLTGVDAPEPVAIEYSATCATLDLRIVATISLSQFVLWTIDRATNTVLNKTVLEGPPFSVTGKRVQAIEANGVPYVLYVDASGLQIGYWTGSQWQFSAEPGVTAFATAKTVAGFHVAMIQGGILRLVEYAGAARTSAHYLPMTGVAGSVAPIRHPAVAVDPDGRLHVVYVGGGSSDDVRLLVLNQDGSILHDRQVNTGAVNPMLTVTTRTLKGGESVYNSVVYLDIVNTVTIKEYNAATDTTVATGVKYWSRLVSHAFTVGNAPMAWLIGLGTSPWFLVAGANGPQVVAFANREDGGTQTEEFGERGLSVMAPDPAGELRYVVSTHRKSNVADRLRLFDVDFLPRLSAVQYGASVYLSGSAPRNWDGMSLGDAGFQDYPIISSTVAAGGGSLSTGQYRFRAYAVRTNARGEKFSSPAISTAPVSVVAGQKVTVTIGSIPTVNSDTRIEVYRTEADGTVYYLDATLDNPVSTLNVTYDSSRSDLGLISQPVDPRAPGIGVDAETQEFGPLGCEFFAVIGDRLWGAGGQVPSGSVQYSKLKEAGEGAGFDSLSSTQVVDLAGNKITSLVPIASGICTLQADQIYILNGDGPNNIGVGTFGVTELRLAGGATTHAGTYNTQIGAVYWGASGPRLLDQSLRVIELWPPIKSITAGRTPMGVFADLDRQEITWILDTGAVHLSFDRDRLRWSEWTTSNIAAVCPVSGVAVTPDGRVLIPTVGVGDDGAPFAMEVETGEIIGDDTLGERTLLQEVGVVGKYEGIHELLLRVSYDRCQTWTDSWTWQPTTNTWLTSGDNYASLTPAQIDALSTVDRSGSYATHKRVSVPQCRSFRFYVSDGSSHGPTTTLHELNFSIGSRPGYGRVSTNKFGG